MTTTEKQPTPHATRIGLWGAPQSGKTTFLAALQIAIVNQSNDDGWLITGVDDAASDFLSTSTSHMNRDRIFPNATSANDVHELRWRFVRPTRGGTGRTWWRRPGHATSGQAVFEVQLLDVSGDMFASTRTPNDLAGPAASLFAEDEDELDIFDEPGPKFDTADPQNQTKGLLDHLATCDGIVYLFDPFRERDSYEYFQRTLEQLARRSYETGRLRDGRLPHHLAVCVTKFDDPAVFRKAHNYGVVLTGDDRAMTPTVPDDLAGEFFRKLCSGPNGASSLLVMRSIEQYFHTQRVNYFVSSAVGFYIGATGVFQRRDFTNVETTPDGDLRIRGQVTPINVLEPFLWLEKQIRQSLPRT
ncbi:MULTISPECIES: hypothetical protein [Protofrankia]|uniref:hypothetical protein n=1 Tax=Protofrankia TaxID=2994361 RepID=UPI00064089FB|nr:MULTISPECIES: hypothetical protein [Protofrankia]ONH37762.1 hypothetical protein BL254_02460 [Protofrankia sp. BMG5.30]